MLCCPFPSKYSHTFLVWNKHFNIVCYLIWHPLRGSSFSRKARDFLANILLPSGVQAVLPSSKEEHQWNAWKWWLSAKWFFFLKATHGSHNRRSSKSRIKLQRPAKMVKHLLWSKKSTASSFQKTEAVSSSMLTLSFTLYYDVSLSKSIQREGDPSQLYNSSPWFRQKRDFWWETNSCEPISFPHKKSSINNFFLAF